jgi:hypothetical protein
VLWRQVNHTPCLGGRNRTNYFTDTNGAKQISFASRNVVNFNYPRRVIMKSIVLKTLTVVTGLVSLSGLYSTSALADPRDYPDPQNISTPLTSNKTRDEVRAEYLKAVREGSLSRANEMDYPTQTLASTLTREQVRAEYFQAAQNGALPPLNDWNMSFIANASSSTLTREAVHADTLEWLKLTRGDIHRGSK